MDTLKKLSMATKAAFLAHKDTNQVNSRFPLDFMPKYETEKPLKQQQKYLTPGKSLLPTLPDFPQAFVRKLSKVLLLTSVGTVLSASPGWAVVVAPTQLTVTVPTGSNNPQADGSTQTYNRANNATALTGTTTAATQTYVDDVLLNSITFNGVTIPSTNISDVRGFQVINGRENVNAEFGDSDTSSDGNPNPFVSAGIVSEGTNLTGDPNTTRESVNPDVQDRALQAAFNSRSLVQGTDGEVDYSYKVIFDQGISENNTTTDNVPEVIFFERGSNSSFSVRAIIGGTFNNPTYAPTTVNVATTNLTPSGINIDTIEINAAQQLGVVGIDLTEFGITIANTPIYGVELTSTGGTGADIYGQFALAQNTSQFSAPPAALVPEPLTILGSGMALSFGALMKIQYSRKRKKIQQIV